MRVRFTRLMWFCNGIVGASLALLGTFFAIETSVLGVRISAGATTVSPFAPALASIAIGISVVAVAISRIRLTSAEPAAEPSSGRAMVAQAH